MSENFDDKADYAPGWDAIEKAVEKMVPEQTPLHWAKIPDVNNFPPQGMHGISAYRSDDHWLFVTFGLSDLYTKSHKDQEWSGFGLELTVRVPLTQEPPLWMLDILSYLGDYIVQSGRYFEDNHWVDLTVPLGSSTEGKFTGFLCALDPLLGGISTPNGELQFIELFGVGNQELELIKNALNQREQVAKILNERKASNPSLITPLG